MDWTRLELTFPVGDEGQRHELLREALERRRAGRRLRFEVRRRFPSRRGGVGGRPRSRPAAHGPEATPREPARGCRRWGDFYDDAFHSPGVGFARLSRSAFL